MYRLPQPLPFDKREVISNQKVPLLATLLPLIQAALLALCFVGVLGTELRLTCSGPVIIHKYFWPPLLGVFVALRFWRPSTSLINVLLLAAPLGVLTILSSDIDCRIGAYYYNTHALRYCLLAGGAAAAAYVLFAQHIPKLTTPSFLKLALVLLQVIVCAGFLKLADGRMIFSDDHPTFLYRLKLLQQHFPHIPFYNTDWNAGYPATEFPVVGVLGIFVLAWPLLAILPDLGTINGSFTYTLIIAYLFIFVVPWSVYFAARLFRFEKLTSVIAAFFALGPTMQYFFWLLHYGTIGFVLSAALLPLVFGLVFRLAFDREQAPTALNAAALAFAAFVALSWPMTAAALLPLALIAIFRAKYVFEPSRRRNILLFAGLFLLTSGPMFFSVLSNPRAMGVVKSTNTTAAVLEKTANQIHSGALPSHSVDDDEAPRGLLGKLLQAVRQTRVALLRFNPVVLCLLVPGLLAIPRRNVRYILSAGVFWLFFISAVGDAIRPQLEFRRLFLHLAFLATIPAAIGTLRALNFLQAEFLGSRDQISRFQWLAFALYAVLLGGLLISPLPVRAAYQNQAYDRYIFAPSLLSTLSSAIEENGGTGRTFFVSFILHDFGASAFDVQDGGHIAPLALFSNHDMFAFYFYHQVWQGVDPIPKSFRDRGERGVEEFFDLLNVTSVVTFNPVWRRYCSNSDKYELVSKDDRFRLFRRKVSEPSYFLKGSGSIDTSNNGLRVTGKETEVIVKFRYFPNLRVDTTLAEIFPYYVYDEDVADGSKSPVSFIGLRLTPKAIKEQIPVTVELGH